MVREKDNSSEAYFILPRPAIVDFATADIAQKDWNAQVMNHRDYHDL